MAKIGSINGSSAIGIGYTTRHTNGRDNSGDFINARLNLLYNKSVAMAKNSTQFLGNINTRGLKKIVNAGDKLDRVI